MDVLQCWPLLRETQVTIAKVATLCVRKQWARSAEEDRHETFPRLHRDTSPPSPILPPRELRCRSRQSSAHRNF